MLQPRRLAVTAFAALLLAACSPSAGPATPTDRPVGSEPVLVARNEPFDDLPPISVADALQRPDGQVVVAGALFVDPDGTLRLCDAIAESSPPQCGGDRITVEGLDLASVAGLEEANGVRWAESVQVFGSVD